MKVSRIEAGEYKVVCKAGTFIVGQLLDSTTLQPFGWDVWENEKRTENAWAWVFGTKREAIEAIKELEKK